MKIYAVVHRYEDCVYIELEPTDDSDSLFLTEEAALSAKKVLDDVDIKKHAENESRRSERWLAWKTARGILEANNFPDVDKVLPSKETFEYRNFESKYRIVTLEVTE